MTTTYTPLSTTPEAGKRKIKPLSGLQMWLYPILYRLAGYEKRAELAERHTYTIWKRNKAARDKRIAQQLRPEARDFELIIKSTLGRLGEFWTSSNINPYANRPGRGGKRRRTQFVEFERIESNTLYHFYKIRVRKKTLFGTKNALPHMVRVRDLVSDDTIFELKSALEREIEGRYDDPRLGAWIVVHRLEGLGGLVRKVGFKEILDYYPDDVSEAPLILGLGRGSKVVTIYLGRSPHGLIGGTTGSGKSNTINSLIVQLALHISPDDLKMVLIDLKGGVEFSFYEGLPHLLKPIIVESSEAIKTLTWLYEEIHRRMKIMQGKAKELAAFNRKYPDQRMHRIVAVVDEFAELTMNGTSVTKKVLELTRQITALGRAFGVHVLICTQRPSAAMVPNDIKVNCSWIIGGRVQNADQSRVIIGTGDLVDLPDDIPGRMYFLKGASSGYHIQTPLITDEQVEEYVKLIIEREKEKTAILVDNAEPQFVATLPTSHDTLIDTSHDIEQAIENLALPDVTDDAETFPPVSFPDVETDTTPQPPPIPYDEQLFDLFLAEWCEIDPTASISAKDLYLHYRHFMNDKPARALSKTKFGKLMTERYFDRYNSGGVGYVGIRKKAPIEVSETPDLQPTQQLQPEQGFTPYDDEPTSITERI